MKKPEPFQRPTRLEAVYRAEIERLFNNYFNFPTTATLGEISARLVEYAQSQNFIQSFAHKLAERMITQVLFQNANSWRQAASKSSKGKIIYSILKNELAGGLGVQVQYLVRQNAKLISTVPRNVANVIAQHIQERQMAGIRSEQIIKEITPKMRQLKKYQIARIARTEVAKADTAVTRVRAESIGLNWYQWQTSEDQRVRPAHKVMDLVLVNWDDAPSPEQLDHMKSQGHYHAGNIYNCRCVALPLVSIDEISFPARVYRRGQIKMLTKEGFRRISGLGQKQIAA